MLHYLDDLSATDDQLLAMESIPKEDPEPQQTISAAAKENILETQLAQIKDMLEGTCTLKRVTGFGGLI